MVRAYSLEFAIGVDGRRNRRRRTRLCGAPARVVLENRGWSSFLAVVGVVLAVAPALPYQRDPAPLAVRRSSTKPNISRLLARRLAERFRSPRQCGGSRYDGGTPQKAPSTLLLRRHVGRTGAASGSPARSDRIRSRSARSGPRNRGSLRTWTRTMCHRSCGCPRRSGGFTGLESRLRADPTRAPSAHQFRAATLSGPMVKRFDYLEPAAKTLSRR